MNSHRIDINFVSIFARGSWRNLGYFLADPLPSLNWWAVWVGGQELKWSQLAHHQLMSHQGPRFIPHSKAKKPRIKAKISGRMVSRGTSDVVTASLYSEKTRLKKLMIMIIIMNKSQETSFFTGARN